MELFKKLRGILFDEVTEEIPIITKEEKEDSREENVRKTQDDRRRGQGDRRDDDVIIRQIETPKRERKIELEDDAPFDMPKLKEEAKEEVKKSSFTFPVWDDDKEVNPKRRERKDEKRSESGSSKRERDNRNRDTRETEKPRRTDSIGYTNAFDYSYGKYKGDYKSSREQSHEILTKTLEQKEERKAFTPSPIISPVYGVLNENYTKDDIVSKKEERKKSEMLDLDSVRRKAYGTLEDEIEVSLSKKVNEEDVVEPEVADYDENDDEGISINDLLVDSSEYIESEEEEEIIPSVVLDDDEAEDEEEIAEDNDEEEEEESSLDKIIPVIDEDDDEEEIQDMYESEEVVIEEDEDEDTEIVEDEDDEDEPVVPDEEEEEKIEVPRVNKKKEKKESPLKSFEPDEDEDDSNMEKTEDKNEAIGEEDLFDLIESIYEGKGEE